jgi:hypothetical protein
MPNGKGSLECCYCTHWRGEYRGYDGAYEEGFCALHRSGLPSTADSWLHRVCSDFEPDTSYERDSPRVSAEERFSWFGRKLEAGVLYAFPYNQPGALEELKDLSAEAL